MINLLLFLIRILKVLVYLKVFKYFLGIKWMIVKMYYKMVWYKLFIEYIYIKIYRLIKIKLLLIKF